MIQVFNNKDELVEVYRCSYIRQDNSDWILSYTSDFLGNVIIVPKITNTLQDAYKYLMISVIETCEKELKHLNNDNNNN